MSDHSFQYTRGDWGGNIFLRRTWPRTVTDEQYRHLGWLHALAVKRGDAIMASKHGTAGGWNLTAPPETFEHLAGIAHAILNLDYQPYNAYRQGGQK